MYDRLIYGKNSLERITSIEPNDDHIEVFVEDSNSRVESLFFPHKYWILASERLEDDWVKLKGNLHYQFGKQFKEKSEYIRNKQIYRNEDTFAIYDSKEACMCNYGYTYFKGMKHDEVSILAFDIEATTLEHVKESKVLLIANTFRRNGKLERKLFSHTDYNDEGEMISDWCAWVRKVNPSIIIGHNIFIYDLPYLSFVADRYGIQLDLGRDGSPIRYERFESKFRKDQTQFYHYHKARVYGRELIDTMFLAIKYDVGRKYESYGLKAIIAAENLEVTDRVFYDASKIRQNYLIPEEWKKIKKYAEHDGDDALALYDLMSPAFFYSTQAVPKSYQGIIESASGSQFNALMLRSYLQEGHSLPRATEAHEFEGAISLGNPGIYRNVFKVDVASLYPNIMLQYEVCDKVKDPDGNFLKLVDMFTKQRLLHKKLAKETGDKYYDDLQNSEKIFINSAYGFLGAPGLLFNSPRGAEFVTAKGREILKQALDWANCRGFTIVNADTDSISFSLEDQSTISPELQVELLNDLNKLYPEKIHFENDGFYPTIIVVKIKNYILWDGKKLKYKGSAIKAPTKEPALQQFIKDVIEAIINSEEMYMNEIYNSYAKEIMQITDIKRWVSRKTITDKVLEPKRTNEQKIKNAIENSEYLEGDRAYFYFKSDGTLGLLEHFDGDYDKDKLLAKLHNTAAVFKNILDVKTLFPNYKLKRNKELLCQIS